MVKLLGSDALISALQRAELPDEQRALIQAVAEAMNQPSAAVATVNPVVAFLAEIGKKVTTLGQLVWLLAGFIGQTLGTLFYRAKSLRFSRAIWHGHVLAAAATQYAAVIMIARIA